VHALPRIRFDMMNSVNASTGFSNFQIQLGQSPQLILPIVPHSLKQSPSNREEQAQAQSLITQLHNDVTEAKDNLFQAKVFQSHFANKNRSPEIPFKVGDKVMLSTLHQQQEYKRKGNKQAAKFFPRFDGPYDIIDVHAATSNYTLKLPNSPNTYPTYHASELKAFIANNSSLFPNRKYTQPRPIITNDGMEEYLIDQTIDSWHCSKGWQYLVQWVGYGPKHN
jgi:hypothetical protein